MLGVVSGHQALCWEELTDAIRFSDSARGLRDSFLHQCPASQPDCWGASLSDRSPGVSISIMKGLNQEYPSLSVLARLTQ